MLAQSRGMPLRTLDAIELEQALTVLAWSDPAFADDPSAGLSQLGVEVPAGLRFDVRVQRRDTLYLIIPPASSDGATDSVVNQMDQWRSGDQFVGHVAGGQAGVAEDRFGPGTVVEAMPAARLILSSGGGSKGERP
jgi:hypothetical protein